MKEYFDLLIVALIAGTALSAVFLLYHLSISKNQSWEKRHSKTTKLIITILFFLTLLTVYGSFLEPKLLITNYYEIDLPNIVKPIKIVFIADLQAGKYKQTIWGEKVADRIVSLKPDLVLLGGDLVDNESYQPEEFDYLEPLRKLAKLYPTYAVPGNHEYGVSCSRGINDKCDYSGDVNEETKQILTNMGIRYLMNDLEKITINSSSFYLFGGDEYWTKKLNFNILATRTENVPTLALIHNPSFILDNYPNIDLVLSGHTHGGQIRLPFVGPVGRVDTKLPTKYYQGLQNLDNNKGKILITSGVGETGVRARLFNPPEVVFLMIK
ncbi:MAG: repair exonuclease family protein [Candidatus Magasanikbacteria bacterium GW2011_GWC2_37_14]|uniref:Repair exonuclease family protein n=1 Tax=Candidatus Magasanikbacteria bacterium GW2011_GWC2_37_14 TaxID=1619046 RepID=A0A0G0GB26_9BACT|nr:MAG: repair exonuclease family protein [Candidatus Magasanikbacteria bacterium GW2011_GWC2_37_14]